MALRTAPSGHPEPFHYLGYKRNRVLSEVSGAVWNQYTREPENIEPKPAAPSAQIAPLIGEYESKTGAHLYLLERGGRLWTIIDRGKSRPASENLQDLGVIRGAGGRVQSVRRPSGTYMKFILRLSRRL